MLSDDSEVWMPDYLTFEEKTNFIIPIDVDSEAHLSGLWSMAIRPLKHTMAMGAVKDGNAIRHMETTLTSCKQGTLEKRVLKGFLFTLAFAALCSNLSKKCS